MQDEKDDQERERRFEIIKAARATCERLARTQQPREPRAVNPFEETQFERDQRVTKANEERCVEDITAAAGRLIYKTVKTEQLSWEQWVDQRIADAIEVEVARRNEIITTALREVAETIEAQQDTWEQMLTEILNLRAQLDLMRSQGAGASADTTVARRFN
jgi:hypothetical protein